MKMFLPIALLALSYTPASAGFTTGNDLASWCSSDVPADVALCVGYVSGVADSSQLLDTPYFCLPDGVERGQLTDVVRAYLSAHPKKLHHPAHAITMVAIEQSFPCP